MHIAIEGLDGAGKTETAKRVAERLGFNFLEKPLHYITDDSDKMDNYLEITNRVNTIENSHFRARFYGTGNYLASVLSREKNIVTDRHLVSNYYCNGSDDEKYFDELVNSCGTPDYTFVLYVPAEERKKRIANRNLEDPDLRRNIFTDEPYEKIEKFLLHYNMNYEVINTCNMELDDVVEHIIRAIKQ